MKTTNLLKTALTISIASFLFVGCSSDDTASANDDTSSVVVQGVIVDPYIEGAVLCEDINLDGECTGSEQNSSASTVDGIFGFDNNLTAGAHIMVKTQGMHEGKLYDLDISGLVADDGSIDVVSPLTTFETKGLTTTQIAAILNNAASDAGLTNWVITADDISGDPLADGLEDKTITELTNADLVNIQASLASYGILKIMSGSDALSTLTSDELYYSGMQMNGHEELYQITLAMLTNIAATLNKDMLESIESGIETGRNAMVTATNGTPISVTYATVKSSLPEPTTKLIIKVAVSIIDRLAEIGYTECNDTGGNVTAALTEVGNNQTAITGKAIALGTQMYGLTYKNEINTINATIKGIMFTQMSDLKTGFDAKGNGKSTVRFDSSNNLITE